VRHGGRKHVIEISGGGSSRRPRSIKDCRPEEEEVKALTLYMLLIYMSNRKKFYNQPSLLHTSKTPLKFQQLRAAVKNI
jgi:hypothetical protein